MSPRRKLIRRTLILCSLPVLVAVGILAWVQRNRDAPYVAGQEIEGITRSLDRELERHTSPLRFTEVSEPAGLRFRHFPFRRTSQMPEDMGPGVAWGDYDADGWPDLFLVNFAAPLGVSDAEMAASAATDRLFRNRGDGRFEDVTQAAGVGRAHRGMGASFADYDGDGDLDVFVTSWGENILWQNQGDGSFREVTAAAGLSGAGFWAGHAWADADLDGDLDLYVCGYVRYVPEAPGSPAMQLGGAENPFTINPSSYPPHPNRFYVNRGDGTFEDRAAAAGVAIESGRSLGAAWADFQGDGLPDLYVANDVSDNGMFINRGDGSFEDVSYEALVADYRSSMGIAVGDWDGDLDLDLFLTHWVAQENALYSNLLSDRSDGSGAPPPLRFSDDADRVGLGQIALDLVGWGTGFVDFDNDGRLDLFVVNGSTLQKADDPSQLVPMDPHLFWNRGPEEGFFEVGEEAGIRTQPPGTARGAAYADYDGDGDADLLIMRRDGGARLLRNDTRGGHWVGFRVRATSGHPSGLGARVLVHAGGRSQLREVGAGPSYLSQNHTDVLVGLGAAERLERVEITWPGGHRDAWRDLEGDRLWSLVEGEPPRLIRSGVPAAAAARRTSGVSEHAVVADLSSALTREQKRRFWQLKSSAQQLFLEGRWEEAAGVYAEMSALDPQHEDALYYHGNSLLELGRYAEAAERWRRLIQVNPASSRAWVQLGILHTLPDAGALFDLDAAVAAFETAHLINREHSRPLVLWGEALVAQGDAEAARRALEAGYRMNPRDASALYLGGYLAWQRGEQALARELLARARASFEAEDKPAHAVLEGDTRSPDMAAARRRAAGRRLFAGCLEALREAPEPPDPALWFPCVERTRAALPRAGGPA